MPGDTEVLSGVALLVARYPLSSPDDQPRRFTQCAKYYRSSLPIRSSMREEAQVQILPVWDLPIASLERFLLHENRRQFSDRPKTPDQEMVGRATDSS